MADDAVSSPAGGTGCVLLVNPILVFEEATERWDCYGKLHFSAICACLCGSGQQLLSVPIPSKPTVDLGISRLFLGFRRF